MSGEIPILATAIGTPWGTRTIYVTKAGDDGTGDGSVAAPYLTIAKASAVASIDTSIGYISIGAGTYTEYVRVPRKRLTYIANGAVIIDGETVRGGIYTNSKRVTIDGIQTINTNTAGIYFNSAPNGTIRNCVCSTAAGDTGSGVYVINSADCTITNVEGHTNNKDGIFAQNSPRLVVDGAYCHDNTAYGVEVEGGCDDSVYRNSWATVNDHGFICKTSLRILIENCVAWANTTSGIYFKGGRNGVVDHCVLYGNGRGAYLSNDAGSAPASTGNAIKNTAIISNTVAGIAIENDGSEVGFAGDYNDFYDNTLAGVVSGANQATLANWQAATSGDANSAATDPNFADPTYDGFELPVGSSLLTAGENGTPIGLE